MWDIPGSNVFCEDCNAQGPQRENDTLAIEAWNRRTEIKALAPQEISNVMLQLLDVLDDLVDSIEISGTVNAGYYKQRFNELRRAQRA